VCNSSLTCDPHRCIPSRHCFNPTLSRHSSLTAHPKKDALILFGGEHNNGRSTRVFSDVMMFYPGKSEWRKLTLPNPPPPRSAHQAVATSGGDAALFVFGGEFTSPNGSEFYHYSDLWKLPLSVRAWERPIPHSTHRCVTTAAWLRTWLQLATPCYSRQEFSPVRPSLSTYHCPHFLILVHTCSFFLILALPALLFSTSFRC
jgi:hypothetical protein